MTGATARLVILIALAAPAVHAAAPWAEKRNPRQQVTADYLMETCHVVGQTAHGMIPHFDCESYVYGVLDSHLAVRDKLPKPSQACFPVTLAPWEALEVAYPHLRRDGRNSQDAAKFLMEALRKKYPCK